MTEPRKRRLAFRMRKSASHTVKIHFKGKGQKKRCAIDGTVLAGTTREKKGVVSKQSRTQRRPTVPFGGVLSGPAREQVFIELGKVASEIKSLDAVDEKYRKYVKQALKRIA